MVSDPRASETKVWWASNRSYMHIWSVCALGSGGDEQHKQCDQRCTGRSRSSVSLQVPAPCLIGLLPRLSELMTTLWRGKVWSSAVSSMSYQRGLLPLGEAEAAVNPQLDKHFSSMTKLLQSRETYAGATPVL